MKLLIKWRYQRERRDEEEVFFEQPIYIKKNVEPPDFCGGSQIVNLYTACFADQVIRFPGEDFFFPLEHPGLVFERYYDDHNSFGKLCFLSCCVETIAEEALKGIRAICRSIRDQMHKEEIVSPDDTFQRACQQRIDEHLRSYNTLAGSYISCLNNRSFDERFYRRLVEVMENYSVSSRLIELYLQKDHGRCFATFIKRDNQEKYIAVSGFLDCDDSDILKGIGSESCPSVINVLQNICRDCSAILVQPTLDIGFFSSNGTTMQIKETLRDVISQGQGKARKDDFSCAERKVFGFFHNQTPDGTLCVKFEMCCKCCKGRRYQLQNGAVIIVKDGLSV